MTEKLPVSWRPLQPLLSYCLQLWLLAVPILFKGQGFTTSWVQQLSTVLVTVLRKEVEGDGDIHGSWGPMHWKPNTCSSTPQEVQSSSSPPRFPPACSSPKHQSAHRWHSGSAQRKAPGPGRKWCTAGLPSPGTVAPELKSGAQGMVMWPYWGMHQKRSGIGNRWAKEPADSYLQGQSLAGALHMDACLLHGTQVH